MLITKEKLNENVQVNFNHSKEIAYWSKKYNISPEIFKKAFEQAGHSISKTLQLCSEGFK
jgi:ABC-type tungstate transport system permease subunit